jgi:hypothetical protein
VSGSKSSQRRYVFKDAGAEMTLDSPLGGQPPLDPKSEDVASQTDATHRFKADSIGQATLANTLKLSGRDQYIALPTLRLARRIWH